MSDSVRQDVVNALVAAAFDAMEVSVRRVHATASEVGSAGLTIALRTIVTMKNLGCDARQLRKAVERLLLECIDEQHSTN